MGPLTSAGHRDRVLAYVEVAQASRAARSSPAARRRTDPALAAGCYVEPTVVDGASRTTASARKRSSDRSSRVTRFKDEAEVARDRQRDRRTGSAAVSGRATCSARTAWRDAIRSGMVWINCYKRVNPGSPFGGVGRSGYGREMGFEAMHEYTEAKSVWVNVDAQIPPFYKR